MSNQAPFSLSVSAFAIYSSIVLMQFQSVAISIFSSRYDPTCFILLLLAFFLMIFGKKNTYAGFIVISLFFLSQILVWAYIGQTPPHRLISGLVWLGGLISLAIVSRNIMYDTSKAYKLIVFSVLFLAAVIYFEYFLMRVDRPKAFFDEPSYAGLVLAAAAGMFLYRIIYERQLKLSVKYREFVFFIACFSALILAKSMHLVTFLIAAAVFVVALRLIRNPALMLLVPFIFFAGFVTISGNTHYTDRLVFAESSNISVLAWLQGFDQAQQALKESPFFGYGVGGTGFVDFDSVNAEMLGSFGLDGLNRLDAYSGLFRLSVETGIVGIVCLATYLFRRLKLLRTLHRTELSLRRSCRHSAYLLVFGLILMLGILIKEPTYSRSYVYLAVFFLASTHVSILRRLKNPASESRFTRSLVTC